MIRRRDILLHTTSECTNWSISMARKAVFPGPSAVSGVVRINNWRCMELNHSKKRCSPCVNTSHGRTKAWLAMSDTRSPRGAVGDDDMDVLRWDVCVRGVNVRQTSPGVVKSVCSMYCSVSILCCCGADADVSMDTSCCSELYLRCASGVGRVCSHVVHRVKRRLASCHN